MADSRRKTVLCRHFVAGTCRRGSLCTYAHGEAELAKRLCGYFLTPGGCKQGDSCSFSHEFSEAEIQAAEAAREMRSTEARGKRICKFFLDGRCNKGSSCTFSHDKGEEEKTDEAPTAAGDDDVTSDPESGPDSPEAVPAAEGAKSMMKAKVTRVHEERALVHLLTDAGDSRVVNLKSFTELWPMPPRCGDRISFPPPPGGPTSRWILPTLESMASSDGSLDLVSDFLKSIQLGYEEQGSSILMRSDMYCQPYLALFFGSKLAHNAKSVSLAKRLLDFLQSILPACRGHGSSASEPGLLLKILQSRLWQREMPKLLQYDGIDGIGDGSSQRSLKDSATSVVNQMLQVVPRYAYLMKPVLLAMMKPQESILQLLNAMSDRLALEDGFFQCATSWRQLPLVPQILSEDLSDLQDLPEVAWMYDSVADYLDTYFRLLRADCFAPLQKGIRDFLNGSLDPRDMRLFRASAQQFHLVRGSKGLVASMECSNIFNYAVPFPARVLMPSNLVCLSISEAPFAEVLWGRVAERPSDRAAQKKETMVVTIEFLDDLNRIDRSSFISCLLAPPPGGLILAESPVFFLSFGPVLRRLQGLTDHGSHGTPLASCLLGKARSAEDAHQPLPWSDFAMDSLEHAIASGQRVFDESQRRALEVILTSTLSTIQGPPGTGKSFTGVEAIRHLLKVPSSLLSAMEPEVELRGAERGARLRLFDSDGSSDESSKEEDLHDLLHRPL